MMQSKWAAWAMAAAVTLGLGAVSTAKAATTGACVAAFDSHEYVVTFTGLQTAAVALRGDGGTSLDLYVYDDNGNLIDAATDNGAGAVVTWTPAWTGRFRIKVVNRGRFFNNYGLGTN